MKPTRFVFFLLTFCFLVIAVGVLNFKTPTATLAASFNQSQHPNQAIGKTLPNLQLIDLQNNKSSLYDYKSDYILINLWATWCPPCRREIPILQKLNNQNKNLLVLGFTYDFDEPTLQYKNSMAISYPLFLSISDKIKLNAVLGNSYGGIPYSVLLNKSYQVIFAHSGEITEQQILQLIN